MQAKSHVKKLIKFPYVENFRMQWSLDYSNKNCEMFYDKWM